MGPSSNRAAPWRFRQLSGKILSWQKGLPAWQLVSMSVDLAERGQMPYLSLGKSLLAVLNSF
jgi:hypothetical protein